MNKAASDILEDLILALPSLHNYHAPKSRAYRMMEQVARREIGARFYEADLRVEQFEPFGEVIFQYHKMGNIDSVDLLNLDELIIFSFYWTNRKRYRHVLDIGANIGLHSVVLSRCGFDVRAFEPDPQHLEILRQYLLLNGCCDVRVSDTAVSSKNGTREFVRVLGNTTANHLAGSKSNSYGDLERFPVKTEAIAPLMAWADLIKLDVEGHEREILLTTSHEHWLGTDALVEIENKENALVIYEYFEAMGIHLFSQKTGWNSVSGLEDMPESYRDGTLFISYKSK
ncbi:MAG: FkbM family methyltransferase, partial [Candidatus Bathyarchaeota archaeon]|nr:FkbM family methyltransferase [Candidatus Bathyarchaeota archaeon]